MTQKLTASLALGVMALALTGSAFASDCIRVSSSLQGLQQSTRSGNWYLLDVSSGASVQQTVAPLVGPLTDAQAACISSTYLASGYTPYVALGVSVAGGEHGGPGVLAHNNPTDVLGNLSGIDHFEESPIGAAAGTALSACLS